MEWPGPLFTTFHDFVVYLTDENNPYVCDGEASEDHRRRVQLLLQYGARRSPIINYTERVSSLLSVLAKCGFSREDALIRRLGTLIFCIGGTSASKILWELGSNRENEGMEEEWASQLDEILLAAPTSCPLEQQRRQEIVDLAIDHQSKINQEAWARGAEFECLLEFGTFGLVQSIIQYWTIMAFTGKGDKLWLPFFTEADQVTKPEERMYYNKCRDELTCMKQLKVCGNTSLSDIFVDPTAKVVNYVRKQNVIEAVEAIDIDERFECYSKLLKRRFKRAMERRDLVDRASITLCNCMKLNDPNHIVIERIVSYLSDQDLQSLRF